jgi:hypothetical protein
MNNLISQKIAKIRIKHVFWAGLKNSLSHASMFRTKFLDPLTTKTKTKIKALECFLQEVAWNSNLYK